MEKAAFGAGCFWGVEAAFRKIKGVKSTAVGYMGGKTENPTYEDVCSDETGHVEVVLVEFDPALVPYDTLLQTFWSCHNPTEVDRQGPDEGTQYRTAIFYYSDEQKATAEKSKQALGASGKFKKPIATAVEPAQKFHMAEDYHQQYLEKKGLASCHIS